MKKIIALIRNEFLRAFDSPMAYFSFFALPLLFAAAIGAGLGPLMGSGEPEVVRPVVEVLAPQDDRLAEHFIAAMAEAGVEPKEVNTPTAQGFLLEIPADFTARLAAGESVSVTLRLPPMERETQVVEQAVQAACGRVGGAVLVVRMGMQMAQDEVSAQEQEALFPRLLDTVLEATEHPSAVVEVEWARAEKGSLPSGAAQASAGQVVTWVQITLLSVASVFVEERIGGTLRRLLITPTRWATLLGGKLLAHLLLGLLQMVVLIAGGELLFHVGWVVSPGAVAAVSIAFALAVVSLGLLLATLVRTRGQAGSLTMGLALSMAALGGAWWPLEITPPLYRQFAHAFPSAWAMDAYTAILAEGASLAEVMPQIGALLGFVLLFATAGVALSGRLRD